ncbi:MAG: carbohydrate deacetylase [Jatrophihabitans sp.]|uniref:carbohydrate deacetylase n=1 Tax=Jatrophihabitans sp. TaxID=1932789 RepID=UPI003F7CF10D
MTARVLIVNADDFGRSPGVNEGTIACHRDGVVTSASLMVRWPDAAAAGAYAAANPDGLSVGLHFDLGEWYWADGDWHERYVVTASDDVAAVTAELEYQLARFVQLVGRPPTHLDSHQHVHRDPLVGRIVAAAGRRLGVPVRDQCADIAYCGRFYGQDGKGYPFPEFVGLDAWRTIVAELPPGITELGCHPGTRDDVPGYGPERILECAVLRDPRARAVLDDHGVRLATYPAARAALATRAE